MAEMNFNIQYDELMYFSTNCTSKNKTSQMENIGSDIEIRFGKPLFADSYKIIPIELSGKVKGVRGLSTIINGDIEQALKGDLLEKNSNLSFLLMREKDGKKHIYMSLIGKPNSTIDCEGVIAYLKISKDTQLKLEEADMRNELNQKLKVKIIDNGKQLQLRPAKFNLDKNYPNPFNSITIIKYSIPSKLPVKLKVYDSLKEEVLELVNETQPAGYYQVIMDGRMLPNGVYFYELTAGEFSSSKKMVLIKELSM